MADIHAHAPWRRAAAQYSSAVKQHSVRHTWPCNKATYLRDGRVGVETIGQGLSSFCAESVRCDIDLCNVQQNRGQQSETKASAHKLVRVRSAQALTDSRDVDAASPAQMAGTPLCHSNSDG